MVYTLSLSSFLYEKLDEATFVVVMSFEVSDRRRYCTTSFSSKVVSQYDERSLHKILLCSIKVRNYQKCPKYYKIQVFTFLL